MFSFFKHQIQSARDFACEPHRWVKKYWIKENYWQTLPTEMKKHIFSFFTQAELGRKRRVNKEWYALLGDEKLMQKADIDYRYLYDVEYIGFHLMAHDASSNKILGLNRPNRLLQFDLKNHKISFLVNLETNEGNFLNRLFVLKHPHIAAVDSCGRLWIWDKGTGTCLYQLDLRKRIGANVCNIPRIAELCDGRIIINTGFYGLVCWDLVSDTLESWSHMGSEVRFALFGRDQIVVGALKPTIQLGIHSIFAAHASKQLCGQKGEICEILVMNKFIISLSAEGLGSMDDKRELCIWDGEQGKCIKRIQIGYASHLTKKSDDIFMLRSYLKDPLQWCLQFWSLKTAMIIDTFPLKYGFESSDVLADGNILLDKWLLQYKPSQIKQAQAIAADSQRTLAPRRLT